MDTAIRAPPSLQREFTIDRPTCLIATSQTWPSTAVLPSLLAAAGARVSGFSPGQLALSGHVREHFRSPREPGDSAAKLLALLRERSFDWTIVADEALMRALAERPARERLAGWFPVDPNDANALGLVLSKFAFARGAARLGLNIPDSYLAESLEAAVAHATALGFPAVVKGDRGFAGLEVRVVTSAAEVRDAAPPLLRNYGRVLVQRYIAGAPAALSVLYARGEPLVYKAYLAGCCYPKATSASTVHHFFEHPDLELIARTVGAATKFNGMLGIDFMLAESGALYPIEINPRPTLGFSGTAANRRFFAPFIRDFMRGERRGLVAYDGREPTQSYFPGYVFYFVDASEKRDARSFALLLASLRESRPAEWRVAGWEILRFVYDGIGARLPRLRAFLDAKRGVSATREIFSA